MTQPFPPNPVADEPDAVADVPALEVTPTPVLPPDESPEMPGVTAPPAPDRTRFAEPVAATPPSVVTPLVDSSIPEVLQSPEATAPPVEPEADVPAVAADTAEVAEVGASAEAMPATDLDAAAHVKNDESSDAEPPLSPVQSGPAEPVDPVASWEYGDEDVTDVPAGGPGLVVALAALVVVLALFSGFLTWRALDARDRDPGPVDASRRAALDAARSSARLVFSYDYRHLDKDFKAGRATTTGQFQGEYDKTTARLVSDVAPRYKAVVQADVSDASVVSATENQVVTLVFLNQQSSSSLLSTPKITQSRLEMTMVRKGGHWLVSKIKAL